MEKPADFGIAPTPDPIGLKIVSVTNFGNFARRDRVLPSSFKFIF